MVGIDWRELYAANQATIRAAVPTNQATAPAPPGALVPGRLTAPRWAARPRVQPPHGRTALVHLPSGLDPAMSTPLVCMLHGCTQDPATFAAATLMNDLADRHGFVVVYPGQDRTSNAQGCWNWFLPDHQRRGAGEPAAIARIVCNLIETDTRCTIDPGRVFVAGLSSGGAMAAILAACYPDLFAALAVHSGLPYRAATDMPSAFRAMSRGDGSAEAHGRAAHAAMGQHARPIPSIVIHGNADHTVAPANATQVLRQSMTANHLAAPHSCNHDVARPTASWRSRAKDGYSYTRSQWTTERGLLMHELLEVDGLGHAWSGGARGGPYTDPRGPSATEAIGTFFSLITATRAPNDHPTTPT
ncbi:MAG: alpha/beta hydrolase family esterase [Solirubrobacteraceae bacterium]